MRYRQQLIYCTPYVRYGVATPILAVVGSNYITTT